MKPLAIIPARGGSKGLPRKNILPLAGRPLIAYTIEAARAAAIPDSRILLTTDDDEIRRTARDLGLDVPYRRPAALATDSAGSREVMLHAMDWADARAIDYDCVLLLQPTSPLRSAGDIRRCLDAYYSQAPDIDMAVTVAEASANPYYNLFETGPDGYLRISKGDGMLTRRQDAPRVWEYNGAVYAIRPDALRTMALGEMPRRVPVEMPRERSVDIDSHADMALAELLLRRNTPQQ